MEKRPRLVHPAKRIEVSVVFFDSPVERLADAVPAGHDVARLRPGKDPRDGAQPLEIDLVGGFARDRP